MKVMFCRSRTPSSWLVRALTWSEWSHVVLLGPDGIHTVEARWPRVKHATRAEVERDNHVIKVVNLYCLYPQLAWNWALDQVGKPYDLTALFGFMIHRDWARPDRWFCSELIAMAFQHGAAPLFRQDMIDRITPQDLWLLPGQDEDAGRRAA
jgi:uncharacterized protein YycO